ncbi:metallo-beta-lactamase superfamily protein [Colletotrichum salicis]|uniref:Metallo-beta-lactamase superfamily protein n=1 Tax=Colletotrichum salicis TaxID=1209931 RepID=A0A135UM64_9PEZI|nr:metallo-beta-lactamase superfamily protein [Colletotrichum salicis]
MYDPVKTPPAIVLDNLATGNIGTNDAILRDPFFEHVAFYYSVVDPGDVSGPSASVLLQQAVCLAGSLMRHGKDSVDLASSQDKKVKTLVHIGFESDQLTHWPKGFQPTLVDFSAGAVGPWETSGRITADGKVVAVRTPGHFPGHISLVVYGDNEDGTTSTYCLLGDTSYGVDLLDKEEPDGINDDPMSALDSLRKIKAFAKQSDVVVPPSRDPNTPRLLKERVLYKPQDI